MKQELIEYTIDIEQFKEDILSIKLVSDLLKIRILESDIVFDEDIEHCIELFNIKVEEMVNRYL